MSKTYQVFGGCDIVISKNDIEIDIYSIDYNDKDKTIEVQLPYLNNKSLCIMENIIKREINGANLICRTGMPYMGSVEINEKTFTNLEFLYEKGSNNIDVPSITKYVFSYNELIKTPKEEK